MSTELRLGMQLAAVRRPARRGAGFTLVELMMALAAGVLVSTAAFVMARNASLFFQHEARATTAQIAAAVGLSRLEADLQRVGFMASADVYKDPRRCGNMADWPAGLKRLSAITIEEGGSVKRHGADHVLSVLNGLSPDALIIGGAVGTTEQFPVRTISQGAGGLSVYLQTDSGPMARARAAVAGGALSFQDLFAPGRFLRIVDAEGRHEYGVIAGFTDDPAAPRVELLAGPIVPRKEITPVCGYSGFGTGTLVNPIARVLYDLRYVDPAVYPRYAGMFATATHPEAGKHKGAGPEPQRTELVRVELDAEGAEIPASLEVVAEFAVDFKLGVTTATAGNTPTLAVQQMGTPAVYLTAADILAGGSPERVRGVQVRLSARARAADRNVGLPAAADGGVFRYNLGPNKGYARVRTLVANVALPNMTGVTW
ncbi:MAG: prepilin-type N-terminal cleavage/methylation domain-containing protein [Deltaproteobacteria bacterium]|nr:prepilin-type N-terminal cleavage/methylation domain-containing protein [Deltaproteobacteria bacterium]